MAPGIMAGGGAAQVLTHDLPTIARLYEMLRQGGRGGGGGGGGGPIIQPSRMQSGLGAGGGRFQNMGGGGGGRVAPQTFSQAERLQMQHLQAAKAGVKKALFEGTITQDQANEYDMYIDMGLNPLTAKLQQVQMAQRQQQMQQQDQEMHRIAALQEAIRQENYKAGIQGVQANIGHAVNPETGRVSAFMLNHKGDPVWIKDDSANQQAKQEELRIKREDAENKRAADWEKHQQDMDNKDWDAGVKSLPPGDPNDPNSEPQPERVREYAKQRKQYREGKAAQREQEQKPPPQEQAGQPAPQQSPAANLGAAPMASGQPPAPARSPGVPTTAEAINDILGKPSQFAPEEEEEE